MPNLNLAKRNFQNYFILLTSLAIVFFLIEVMLRVFSYHEELFKAPKRFLMWSVPLFKVYSNGAVRFAENTSIREVAVYNDAIEYDMVYKTNNFGCIDDQNYDISKNCNLRTRRYALVGDSFTAGSGAGPWVPQLRNKLVSSKVDVVIYNFGMPGAGLRHFLKILESMSRYFDFTDIVILGLSNDMERLYWIPIIKNDKIFFWARDCEDKEVSFKRGPVATIIDRYASKDEILNHVKKIEQQETLQQRSHKKPTKEYVKNILSKSRLFYMIQRNLGIPIIKTSIIAKRPVRNEVDFTPLIKIRSLFPKAKIYFIHLPEVVEVRKKHYYLNLKDRIESLGITYVPALTECYWSDKMFLKNDGHPNADGYRNISNFIEACLFKHDP